jgi:hypothetical protein
MATALSPNFQIAPPGSPAARPRSEAAIVAAPSTPAPISSLPAIRSRRVRLPEGLAGTVKTIRYMERLAMGPEGARSPNIRALALHIVSGVANRDYPAQIRAVYDWVRRYIAFRGEHAETVQSPELTVRLAAGDCDCQATLLAALLGSIGFKTRFVTVAGDPEEPDEFSHVYLEVRDRTSGQWVPLDTTDPNATPGWAPTKVTRRKEWAGMGATAASDAMALANEFGTPLIDAAAQRLAYGQAPFAPGLSPTPLGGGISPITKGGISGNVIIFGALGVLALVAMRKR